MSTFEPSASARPFVTSGIALAMPPEPVLVPMPAPVRLNHVSSVNCAAPSPGAAPIVTYWLDPLNANACAVGGGGCGVAVVSEAADELPDPSTATSAQWQGVPVPTPLSREL